MDVLNQMLLLRELHSYLYSESIRSRVQIAAHLSAVLTEFSWFSQTTPFVCQDHTSNEDMSASLHSFSN